ncbi:death-inducer obliterator 1-like isoform X1 [Arapaima gigas]
MLAVPDMQDSRTVRVRRCSRRVRSTDEVIQILSTASQQHGGMGSTPIYLECSEPFPGPTIGGEADSRKYLNKSRAVKTAEKSPATRMASERMTGRKKRLRCNSDSGDVSSDMEDSDELTLKELQELLRKRKKGSKDLPIGSDLGPNSKKEVEREVEEDVKVKSHGVQDTVKYSGRGVPRRTGKDSRLAKECLQSKAVGKLSIWSSDSEEEEKEMGDTEENDSSSQSDPNAVYCICRQKRNKRFMICCDHCEEWFHGDCVGITEAHGRMLERNGEDYICPVCTSHEIQKIVARNPQNVKEPETKTESSSTREQGGMEEGHNENQKNFGIGLTINASGKGSVDVLQLVPGVTGLARCIGPACSKNALPDSVYCGRDCILLHAAATMKSLEAAKKYRQRPKTQTKVQKKSVRQRSIRNRTVEIVRNAEDGREFNTDIEGPRQHPATPPWPTDQNCNAAKLEESVASSSFCKLCMEPVGEDKAASTAKQKLSLVTCETLEGGHRPTDPEQALVGPAEQALVGPAKQAQAPVFGGSASKKPPVLPGRKFTKATCAIPRRLSVFPRFKHQWLQNRQFPPASFSVLRPPQLFGPPGLSKPPKSQPSDQMRQNIHRSLKEILYRRVSDSDDLQISESEIGKLAVNIEKEIFNMFLNTEAKYKNKYRSVMFHLKDPKNKALFYRVVCGEVTPFRLVRLTPEQLLCREVPEQRNVKQDELKREMAPGASADDPPPLSDEQEHPDPTGFSDTNTMVGLVPDVFCSMLMDTTTEHTSHLFDLNCKICTGLMSADEEVKKPEALVSSSTQEVEPKAKLDALTCKMDGTSVEECFAIEMGSKSLTSTENTTTTSLIPVMTDEVSVYHPFVTETITAIPSTTKTVTETRLVLPSLPVSSVSHPKSVLLKPTSSPTSKTFSVSKSLPSSSDLYEERETTPFLSKQQILWNGFISMHSVTKFATKAYLVSGFFDCLVENLPYIIQIGGRISPHTVWDYVGKLKASLSKELCLIRFFPSSEEEKAAYFSLFSYFSSRGRFGVVANNKPHVKDLYVIPLSATDPVPCHLLPFHGPGLESSRPHLLLGLIICQKQKCSGIPQESEKTITAKTGASENSGLANDLPVSTTSDDPFSTCPSISLTDSLSTPSVISKPSTSSLERGALTPVSSACTPLQMILNTLFGKKKHNWDGSKQPPVESAQPHTLLFDPIVRKFGHISNEEDTGDDRPYDPEEEYNLETHYGTATAADAAEAYSANPPADDVAYDPEDESVFEEMLETAGKIPTKTLTKTLSEKVSALKSNSSEFAEQQRMLEELNKEIELQRQQVEEQEEVLRQQKAAIGLSMAHFSVSDALMSPPSKLSQSSSWMLQLEEETKNSDVPVITKKRDPMQSEELLQGATKERITFGCPAEVGIGSGTPVEERSSQHFYRHSKLSLETPTVEDTFLEGIKIGVSLSGEEKLHETEGRMLSKASNKAKVKDDTPSAKGQRETNPYITYQNSSSIIEANDKNAPTSESLGSSCMYTVDPLIPPVEMTASAFDNIQFQGGALGIYPSYEDPSQQQLDFSPGATRTSYTSVRGLPSFRRAKQVDSRAGELPEHHWSLQKFSTSSSNENYLGRGCGSLPFSRTPENFSTLHSCGPQGGSFDPQYDLNCFPQGAEQHEQIPPHSNREDQLFLPGLHTGLSHHPSQEWRTPSQQHFPVPTCCRSPRTFRAQSGLPPRLAWDTRTQPQFNLQGQHVLQDGRQPRRSGPLLPTPPRGSVQMHHSSAEVPHQNRWRCSSDARRSSAQMCSVLQNGADKLSSCEGGQRGREWVRCPEDWRSEQDGGAGRPRRTSLQRDTSEGRQRHWERAQTKRREADWHKKEDDPKKDSVLKREQKDDRSRERDQQRKRGDKHDARNQGRDCERESRPRRRSSPRARDKERRKQRDSGRCRIRDGGQDRDSGQDAEKEHNHSKRAPFSTKC